MNPSNMQLIHRPNRFRSMVTEVEEPYHFKVLPKIKKLLVARWPRHKFTDTDFLYLHQDLQTWIRRYQVSKEFYFSLYYRIIREYLNRPLTSGELRIAYYGTTQEERKFLDKEREANEIRIRQGS